MRRERRRPNCDDGACRRVGGAAYFLDGSTYFRMPSFFTAEDAAVKKTAGERRGESQARAGRESADAGPT